MSSNRKANIVVAVAAIASVCVSLAGCIDSDKLGPSFKDCSPGSVDPRCEVMPAVTPDAASSMDAGVDVAPPVDASADASASADAQSGG
jgi:hypothetical protein